MRSCSTLGSARAARRALRTVGACAVALVAVAFAPTAQAQAGGQPAAPGSYKIGVVDLAKVFKQYERSAELERRINEEKDRLAAELEEQRKKTREIRKTLDQLEVASEEYQLREEEQRIELARLELMKERLQRTIKSRWEQYNIDLLEDIEKVVKEYGKQHGFTLIFKVEGELIEEHKIEKLMQVSVKSVLYFSSEVDITEDVVLLLNQRFRVGQK